MTSPAIKERPKGMMLVASVLARGHNLPVSLAGSPPRELARLDSKVGPLSTRPRRVSAVATHRPSTRHRFSARPHLRSIAFPVRAAPVSPSRPYLATQKSNPPILQLSSADWYRPRVDRAVAPAQQGGRRFTPPVPEVPDCLADHFAPRALRSTA